VILIIIFDQTGKARWRVRGWQGVVRSGRAGLAELEEGENFTMAMLRDWCLFGMKDDGIDGTKDFCYKER